MQATRDERERVALALIEMFNAKAVEQAIDLVTPDFAFKPISTLSRRGDEPYRGGDGLRRYAIDAFSSWLDLQFEAARFEHKGDTLHAIGILTAVGLAGSARGSAPTTLVFEFRDGRIASVTVQGDQDAIERAMGIEEPGE